MSKTYTVPSGSEVTISTDAGGGIALTLQSDDLVFTEEVLDYVGEAYTIFASTLFGAEVFVHVKNEDIVFEIPVGERI